MQLHPSSLPPLPSRHIRISRSFDVQLRQKRRYRLLSLRRRRMEVEAMAFHSVCRGVCFPSCFCWSADSRFRRQNWSFHLDWCRRCLSMCFRIDKWANVLDITLGVSRLAGTYSNADTCGYNLQMPRFLLLCKFLCLVWSSLVLCARFLHCLGVFVLNFVVLCLGCKLLLLM